MTNNCTFVLFKLYDPFFPMILHYRETLCDDNIARGKKNKSRVMHHILFEANDVMYTIYFKESWAMPLLRLFRNKCV